MDKRAIQKKIRKIVRQQDMISNMITTLETRFEENCDTVFELIDMANLSVCEDEDESEETLDFWLEDEDD